MADDDERTLIAGVAQTNTVLGDLDANLDDHLRLVDQARGAGCDCLLFPEMSLTGHSAGGRALDLALARDDPRIDRLVRASGPMRTTVGLIEEGPAAQFYNSAVTVADGRVVHVHRKVNLATYGLLDDGKHFAPGRYVETFPIGRHWRAATLICNDLWNPMLVGLAALHGATILLAPVSSAREAVGADFDNPGGWETACRYSAMVYGMPILFANRVGREGDLRFWGGSRIVDPFGHTIEGAGEAEGLTLARLDFGAVRRARLQLPTVRDSNLDLLVRETTRLQRILGVPDAVRRDWSWDPGA
ncbi:nitrilase-related carbon-nitrogen hydrolase [Jannaschia sp. LMIT008]|uniref:nitrilase-related carbon-nitrogen hydrolase n=1 Tax=Jannaschia maritima TaxID=3032585 RepID=UPI002811679B|nr:nitrilase-related carbon-nitrogen hydrolase [Jannaschia sp. LMIT008]